MGKSIFFFIACYEELCPINHPQIILNFIDLKLISLQPSLLKYFSMLSLPWTCTQIMNDVILLTLKPQTTRIKNFNVHLIKNSWESKAAKNVGRNREVLPDSYLDLGAIFLFLFLFLGFIYLGFLLLLFFVVAFFVVVDFFFRWRGYRKAKIESMSYLFLRE